MSTLHTPGAVGRCHISCVLPWAPGSGGRADGPGWGSLPHAAASLRASVRHDEAEHSDSISLPPAEAIAVPGGALGRSGHCWRFSGSSFGLPAEGAAPRGEPPRASVNPPPTATPEPRTRSASRPRVRCRPGPCRVSTGAVFSDGHTPALGSGVSAADCGRWPFLVLQCTRDGGDSRRGSAWNLHPAPQSRPQGCPGGCWPAPSPQGLGRGCSLTGPCLCCADWEGDGGTRGWAFPGDPAKPQGLCLRSRARPTDGASGGPGWDFWQLWASELPMCRPQGLRPP